MKLTEVTLKDGKKINILPGEVEGLRKLGKLKEEKKVNDTKEEKKKPQTKEKKPKEDPVNVKPPLSTARNLKNVNSGD